MLNLLGPLLARQLLPVGPQALPAEVWEALVAIVSRPHDFATAAREAEYGLESFAQAHGGPGSLGDLPLEILTAGWWTQGKASPMKRASVVLRREMAGLSSIGKHVIVPHCGHSDLPIVCSDAVAASVRRLLDANVTALPAKEALDACQ